MKKLFILAITTAALASCSESDLPGNIATSQTQDQAVPVAFSTYIGETATRAGETDAISTTKLQDENYGFGVFAYNTGATNWDNNQTSTAPNFMYNQKVAYNSNSEAWEYAPLKYWPNGKDAANSENNPSNSATEATTQKISFFAYAPYAEKVTIDDTEYTLDVTSGEFKNNETTYSNLNEAFGITKFTSNDTQGAPTVTFKFKGTGTSGQYDISESKNVDLLWGLRNPGTYFLADASTNTLAANAEDAYNVDITKPVVGTQIDFKFKHALAKMGGATTDKSGIMVVADFDANETDDALAGAGSLDQKTTILLNSITIANGVDNENNSTLAAGGVLNLATGKWTASGDKMTFFKEYNTTGNASTVNEDVWEKAVPTYSTSENKWSKTGVTTTAKKVFTGAEDAIYFIPTVTNSTLEVTVQYTVRTYDANLQTENNGSACEKHTQTITNNIDIASLQPNKAYTLVIHLGMTSVKFAAVVADWDQADQGTGDNKAEVIWLPSNVVTESGSGSGSGE